MNTVVVIPNWNGRECIEGCIESLQKQTQQVHIIVVDNDSADDSAGFIQKNYPGVQLIINKQNKGFAGGVNTGLRSALEQGFEFVALLNNDATVDKNWVKRLTATMKDEQVGIATGKITTADGKHIDSTGDTYTAWGLPYPRGRGEAVAEKYNEPAKVFSASGGASMYRSKMLNQIGLFDEDFFMYYEDIDISFRAQLAGWKVAYSPAAVVYHQIGMSSAKVKGLTTYQTLKNLPWVFWKNVPIKLFPTVAPRLFLAYWSFVVSALARGQIIPVVKGVVMTLIYLPKKLLLRHKIQYKRKVSVDYIWNLMTHDLPPNAHRLRRLRRFWWKLKRNTSGLDKDRM